MIKKISKLIDKFLYPNRVQKGLCCNDGIWWWAAPIMQAIGEGLTAVGLGGLTGAAAAPIAASAAGTGLAATGATAINAGAIGALGGAGAGLTLGSSALSTALPASLITAATPSLMTGAGEGIAATLGTKALTEGALQTGIKAIGSEAVKEGLMTTVATTLSKELLGFDPKAGLKENASNMAVKQVEGSVGKKNQTPPDVNINNSYQGEAPKIMNAETIPKRKIEGSLPPEVMMKIVQMMQKQKAQGGGTRPLASAKKFPGGYY